MEPNSVLAFWRLICDTFRKIVDSKYFGRGIMIAILVNTLSMGIEYHEQVGMRARWPSCQPICPGWRRLSSSLFNSCHLSFWAAAHMTERTAKSGDYGGYKPMTMTQCGD